MTRLLIFLAAATLAAAQPSAPGIARAAVDEFIHGRFNALALRINPEPLGMTNVPAKLGELGNIFFGNAGVLGHIGDATCRPTTALYGATQHCAVTVDFSDEDVALGVFLDASSRIVALGPDRYYRKIAGRRVPDFAGSLFLAFTLMLVILMTAVLHFMPAWGNGLLFGIMVGDEFKHSPEARAMLRRYRAATFIGGLLVLILFFAAQSLPHTSWLGYTAPIFSFAMMIPYTYCAVTLWPHRLHADPVRIADLTTVSPVPRWLWVICALPAVVLFFITAYLAAHWSEIPAAAQSFRNIFGPVLVGWSMLLVAYFHAVLAVWGTRRDVLETRAIRAFLGMQLAIVTLVIAPQTILAFQHSRLFPSLPVGAATSLALVLAVAASLSRWWRGFFRLAPAADPTPRDRWRGWFYINADDPAWMVRVGLGFVPNFGHRWIALGMALILTQALAAYAFAFL